LAGVTVAVPAAAIMGIVVPALYAEVVVCIADPSLAMHQGATMATPLPSAPVLKVNRVFVRIFLDGIECKSGTHAGSCKRKDWQEPSSRQLHSGTKCAASHILSECGALCSCRFWSCQWEACLKLGQIDTVATVSLFLWRADCVVWVILRIVFLFSS
jgi:hypothetical protein